MGWSSRFLSELGRSNVSPLFLLRGERVADEPGQSTVKAGSHRVTGGIEMITAPVVVGGSSVRPVTWTAQYAGLRIGLAGDGADLLSLFNRGQFVRLYVGFPGWDPADYEPVFAGQVRGMRGTRGLYTLEVWDVLTALQSRITTTASELSLFSNVGSTTTLGSGYTVGDSSISVADSSIFELETSGTGVLGITPSGGSEFYLTFTSAGGGTVSGLSSTGQYGTTAGNASTSDTVTAYALLQGHPFDILRKLLASGGGGGTYDVYPSTWGYGIPDSWLDNADIDATKGWHSVASSQITWDVVVTAAQANGLSWLAGLMKAAGMWPVQRQGQISARMATSPVALTPTAHPAFRIDDNDIAEIVDWQAWDPAWQVEYGQIEVLTATGGTTVSDGIATLPALEELQIDLSGVAWDNEGNQQSDTAGRLGVWARRVGERIRVRLASRALAGLVPGDFGYLTTGQVVGRGGPYNGTPCMVVEASGADWQRGGVTVTLSVLPDFASAFK